ncbi:TetR/AcrR family transcriptional regulator [Pseudodonghicola flavimaris]|uniref:TetR/AcrR family transcriptional regulator n=1 Tax=Pseudodonghicola flavimaris TaxID=3050036 RepID=A0ABT7F5P7_9RHOB|nr:TetR/AcrR family transcriptional regulator [Pseudodonghicola flavimaris]MDK3019933.1 TetR/AcrR family transcriptional regulator [Pseudodonghicola flavimaris]
MGEVSDVVRTGRKFHQVLSGAREVFMADGFEGASVDDIARAAGVSKATLYSYFPDKRILFIEVVTNECNLMAERALNELDASRPPREVLTTAAHHILSSLLSEFSQRIFRIVLAERERFPELGSAFYACGPEMGTRRLSEYLAEAVAQGSLVIDDIPMAAEQFSELCKARLWVRAMFGVQNRFSEAEIDEVARNAVDMFMSRYGA